MVFYTIKEAIRSSNRLKLLLADGEQLVEPHVLGRNRRGKTLLRAYLLDGPSGTTITNAWKLFDMDRILHAVDTGECFGNPRQGYRRNDPSMDASIIESL
jgi:hypothetical protein